MKNFAPLTQPAQGITHPGRRWAITLCVVILCLAQPVAAELAAPSTDPFALTKTPGQDVAAQPVQINAEPVVVPTPQLPCGPGSRPEPDIQGRVPAGASENGLWCNAQLVGHHGTSGGFKVLRYVDHFGRECAYYDTALVFPENVLKLDGSSSGVVVLDMSDPSSPEQTDTLTELPMLAPHESLIINEKRGLIAAVHGTIGQGLGEVSIYDATKDCRHPILQSTSPTARWGHETGWSPDGNTLYATSQPNITAIDVTDPKSPKPIWLGNVTSHGMTVSDDGNRGYVASDWGGNMFVLDLSEIQARKPNPSVREVSRMAWTHNSRPQNAISFIRDGKPYLLEIDEAHAGLNGGDTNQVGAARIIDIEDEKHPRVISNLRLKVQGKAEHAATANDPGAANQGYVGHYCDLDRHVDPQVVACSFVLSGLRIFDISDLVAPKEIAYFVAPSKAVFENQYVSSPYAMSRPAIAPERHEVWYTDVAAGFSAVRVADSVWPKPATMVHRVCNQESVTLQMPLRRGTKLRSKSATLDGMRLRIRRNSKGVLVRFIPPTSHAAALRIRIKQANGKVRTLSGRYRQCTPTS